MATILFNEIIFGPVLSRRLGESLGINLLPVDSKFCNFNCLYCECGFTLKSPKGNKITLSSSSEVRDALEKKLLISLKENTKIDSITFAGNGEPTLHPEFPTIIDDTIKARDKYYPSAKIAVLSNATLIGKPLIREALRKADFNILKLDSVNEETLRLINCPIGHFSLPDILENLKNFQGKITIQTLFVRGEYKGKSFDNSTEKEVNDWLKYIQLIHPELVMIYTFRRDTPIQTLEKISQQRLQEIAMKVQALGIQVSVSA